MKTVGISCPQCGKRLVFIGNAARSGKCSACGTVVSLPACEPLIDLPLASPASPTHHEEPTPAPTLSDSSSESISNIGSSRQHAHPQALWRRISADDFRIGGEHAALGISLLVTGFVLLVLLGMTLGLVLILIAISGIYVEVTRRQMLGQAVKVSEAQLPEVHRAVTTAAHRLTMDAPDTFVTQNPTINAFAMGFFGGKCVVLHSALVEAMDADELLFVVGHELSHVKCGHTSWSVIAGQAGMPSIPVVSQIMGLVFYAWSRKAEYTSDRGGLLASRDLRAAVTAQAKIAVGKQLFERLNVDALFQQKTDVTKDGLAGLSEALGDHPYVVNRMHALVEFHSSPIYRQLVGP